MFNHNISNSGLIRQSDLLYVAKCQSQFARTLSLYAFPITRTRWADFVTTPLFFWKCIILILLLILYAQWGCLHGLAVGCWTTDHYYMCSNLSMGTSEGCFITFGGRSAHLAYHMHKSGSKTSSILSVSLAWHPLSHTQS